MTIREAIVGAIIIGLILLAICTMLDNGKK